MPRATPCRTLKVLTWPWLLMIGLYFFLSTSVIPPHQRAAYIQNKLASGNTAITAIDYSPFRDDSRDICYECTDLMIHWRLVHRGRDVFLFMSYDDYGSINMTNALERALNWNIEQWEHRSSRQWVPYFSVPMTMRGIPGGSIGEEIAMPWFHTVDQKLIKYNMHNSEASVFVRAVVPEPGIVQIWRSKFVDWAVDVAPQSVEPQKDYVDNFLPSQKSLEQVAYEQMMLYKQETDFLASFHLVESWEDTLVVMEHLAGELPSRTYTIRRALLVLVGPLIAIPFVLFSELDGFMSFLVWFLLACLGLMVARGLYRKVLENGHLQSFCRLCWPRRMSRHRRHQRSERKQVWGPAGPVGMREDGGFDEESNIGLRRPETVRFHKR